MNKNIVLRFLDSAGAFPDRIAIIDKNGKMLSYNSLSAQVMHQASKLRAMGIGKGDRVLVFVPMSTELYSIVIALFYNSSVAVFVDEWVNRDRLVVCCKLADCKGFVADRKIRLLALTSKEIRKIPIWLAPGNGQETKGTPEPEMVAENDPALITFTTGSTGIPKAANRTHGFLQAQFSALIPLISSDLQVDMPMLPIVLLLNLGLGKTSVIADFKSSKPKEFKPEKLVSQLLRNKVQSITASPYFLLEIAAYCLKNQTKVPDFQRIISGGGPIFPQDAEIVNQAFPNADFTIVYGSTEAEPISHLSSVELLATGSTQNPMTGLPVGIPDSSVEIAIIPIFEGAVNEISPLSNGMHGEIVVAGNHVLSGYWKNEEATRQNKIDVEGKIWHRTGDAGYLTENGSLFLLGRCQERVKLNKEWIFPFQIEFALRCLDSGLKGTLVQMTDTRVALVIESVNQKPADDHILSFLKVTSVPIIWIKQIPMDKRHHTKIDYSKLKELIIRK